MVRGGFDSVRLAEIEVPIKQTAAGDQSSRAQLLRLGPRAVAPLLNVLVSEPRGPNSTRQAARLGQ
jgi:hypothetical protein